MGWPRLSFVVLRVGLSTQPGDEPPYAILGGAVGIYLLGIIVMQAAALARTDPDPVAGPTPAGRLSDSPEALRASLVLPGTDAARAAAGARAAHRQSIGLFVPTALIAILLPLGGYLYISGTVPGVWQPFGESGIGIPVAALPGLALVLVLFLMLPFNMKRARLAADDINAPLGLAITATPRSILLPRIGTDGIGHHVVGPTTMEGVRYGRPVVVDAYVGSTAVLVGAPTEPFRLRADAGRLRAEGPVPGWLADALSGVPADPRWHKVQVLGGADGIRADRRGSALDSDWMLDLWLAEYLAAARGGQPAS